MLTNGVHTDGLQSHKPHANDAEEVHSCLPFRSSGFRALLKGLIMMTLQFNVVIVGDIVISHKHFFCYDKSKYLWIKVYYNT